jgi:conjugal transfer pilus assembly protein TraW
MKIYLIIAFFLFPVLASAGVIGTVGQTYPFAERDALTEVQEAAKKVNWKKLLAAAKEQARHYRPSMLELRRATVARKRQVDMSYTLDVDVPDPRDPSRILYPKGYSFNPLHFMTMPACVVFINAGDRAQRDWLISSPYGHDLLTPILLTGGDVDGIERALKRPVYSADSLLLERFGIEVVPSVACQNGDSLEVEEINVHKNAHR